ncbi:D-glycero-beta-D-manno-heptose 1-phosphate adenylyltransferase [Microcoleus sp. LEGE 07076]|uniref:D-glycero-beta-D-manno-heptose 1-phosphate adenylyltransferase n=1 Tax=Microcoleus sp. LEGE 07076 TaxID=915322 RepID=UPI0018828213|nr:D-glycero-beta-D-manno-heptose 1-phosphate adenylyltransferase [Microcoleus sp. LEGE 07076]MBE9188327.1 D-glycero-beta-D-manno-heptose 1-phosphate adenylyltransferase [Microcoleus sp. LEGE 07076]
MISGVYTLRELEEAIASAADNWRPIVFTNGCFDILHCGHVRYLQAAKKLGRTLVVGLNSDESVQTIKPQQPGLPPRPIVPENQRAEVLAALKPVDAVVIFSEITATKLINILKPDIYVKGGDYQLETLPEAPAVIATGGKISLIEIEVLSSTSAIVQRILHLGA